MILDMCGGFHQDVHETRARVQGLLLRRFIGGGDRRGPDAQKSGCSGIKVKLVVKLQHEVGHGERVVRAFISRGVSQRAGVVIPAEICDAASWRAGGGMRHQHCVSLTGEVAGLSGHDPVSASGALRIATSTRRRDTRCATSSGVAALDKRRTIGWRNICALRLHKKGDEDGSMNSKKSSCDRAFKKGVASVPAASTAARAQASATSSSSRAAIRRHNLLVSRAMQTESGRNAEIARIRQHCG